MRPAPATRPSSCCSAGQLGGPHRQSHSPRTAIRRARSYVSPAASDGFTIAREYFLPDGTPVDPQDGAIAQNDRLVVVLTVRPQTLGSGQYVVADPLPAGFEIENPDLSAGSGVADFSWLSLDTASHVESRTDQYVAAFEKVLAHVCELPRESK